VFTNKITLKFSEQSEHMKGQLSCRRSSLNFFGHRFEIDVARSKLGCEMDEITETATELVSSIAKRRECHLYATISGKPQVRAEWWS
jgi:hypothetical protein